jgi:hypothetical protein
MTTTCQNSSNQSELLLLLRLVFSNRHFMFFLSTTLDVTSKRKFTLYFRTLMKGRDKNMRNDVYTVSVQDPGKGLFSAGQAYARRQMSFGMRCSWRWALQPFFTCFGPEEQPCRIGSDCESRVSAVLQ